MAGKDPNGLIETVYNAVLEDNGWEKALTALMTHANCTMGCVELVDYSTGNYEIMTYQGHPGLIYAEDDFDWVKEDPWGNAVDPSHAHNILVGSQLADPTHYLQSEYISNMASLDIPIKDLMASANIIDQQALFFVSLYRDFNQPFIDEGDMRDYELVHQHVRRALDMTYRLSGLRTSLNVYEKMTDTLPYAFFAVSCDHRITLKNRIADAMLRRKSPVTAQNGYLHAARHEDEKKLQLALKKSTGTYSDTDKNSMVEATSFMMPDLNGGRSYSILVFPVSAANSIPVLQLAKKRIRAIVCITNQQAEFNPKIQHIAVTYGLTAAEEKLLTAVTHGEKLSDIARRTGRSVETLRSQLKSIFAKTECRSQTDLLRLTFLAPMPF